MLEMDLDTGQFVKGEMRLRGIAQHTKKGQVRPTRREWGSGWGLRFRRQKTRASHYT
jgi:hypothetical protein